MDLPHEAASPFADVFSGARPLALPSLVIPSSWRVVVLAPHPDDFEQFAETMRVLRDNGNPIDLAVVTSGASGVEDGFKDAWTREAKAALREDEQRDGCRRFGLPEAALTLLRLSEDDNGDPEDNAVNRASIEAYLEASRPALVFLPHGHDPNEGHRRTYTFFRHAVRHARLSGMACLGRDPKTVAMRFDLFSPFGEAQAAWKAEILLAHQSQHQRNLHTRGFGFDERILRVNRAIAAELGLPDPFAEVFELEVFG